MFKRSLAIAVLFAAATAATPSKAVPGGKLGTLTTGSYICELPGTAAGPAGVHVPSEDFLVVSASSYIAGGKRGVYLLTGDLAVMTTGPFRGKRYRRIYDGFLRQLGPDGEPGPLRCIRRFRSTA